MRSIFTVAVLACSLAAQTLVPDIAIDAKRLDSSKKQDIMELQDAMTSYVYSQSFSNDDYDYEVPFKIQIYVESVDETSAEIMYSCQAFFTNAGDQRYVETGWRFPYSRGTPLYRSGIYDPIASLLDFYGYMICASELDGIELNGGTSLFNKAQEVIEIAQQSKYAAGWQTRQTTLKDISSNFRLRRAKLHLNECFWSLDENNLASARTSLEETLKLLEENVYLKNKDKYTRIFIESHYQDVTYLVQAFEDTFFLPAFRRLSPENREFFDRIADPYK